MESIELDEAIQRVSMSSVRVESLGCRTSIRRLALHLSYEWCSLTAAGKLGGFEKAQVGFVAPDPLHCPLAFEEDHRAVF